MKLLSGSGREAEVYEYGASRVLKLFRERAFAGRVERERAALAALQGSAVRAPKPFDVVEVDGRPGLVMEKVEGVDFLTLLERAPYFIWRSATVLGRLHVAMHDVIGPPSLPRVKDIVAERIEGGEALSAQQRSAALGLLRQLPDGDRLCHGDFHPGNVLGSFDSPVIIDWGDASRGDPTADVARTLLLYRMSALPDRTPGWLKALAKVARRIPARRYQRVYTSARRVDRVAVHRWLVARVAARFVEGIEAEYDTLDRFLRRNLRT